MDAYIGIRGGENCNELSDVPENNMKIESEFYSHPVHHEIRVKKTKDGSKLTSDIDASIESHVMGFRAEKSRLSHKKVEVNVK